MNINPLERLPIQPQDIQINMQQIEKSPTLQDDASQTKTAVVIDDNKNLENLMKEQLRNPEELKKLIEELQNKISYLNKSLKIEIDRDINEPIIKIVEVETNKVIRQIPPDYMINIIKNINKMLGSLFNEKV
ncbi:flagellar protein FlaG [Sulfurihydrogenibium azorense Az-Fu1]|uniref:Flagellar protein FlaG n=1 Tax=Sulfurihydrogenibium azorense (strain DSM 15241 / OCM 825 / Az-Fu1) TaxID=204536 RepID=C1DVE4_SULAA|nr:flagellar protein FlaG [Sulfurihydrogenibium azorense]ACN99092.1 flagellar protein FlaG [Sulfurihydrogenibium azorense Az-Fu1]